MNAAPDDLHHVVIVGAGFGGLEAAFGLAGAPVENTLVDAATTICSSRYSIGRNRLARHFGDRLADPLSAARPARRSRRCSPA